MELVNGRYEISGVNLLSLCDKYGTPLYVYNFEKIESQYKRLVNAFGNTNMKVLFACKALTNQSVLKFLKNLGSGCDTVSIEEVHLALRAGFSPENIVYTPNCVSMDEITKAVELGVKINIDNISILEQFGDKYGNQVPVTLRLNPHIFAGGNPKISVGHIDSKFGISIFQLRHVHRVLVSTKVKVTGLHMHTGSDILDVDVFLNGADVLLDAAKDFPDLETIDFGSGFKVPYKPEDKSTDIESLGEKLSKRFNQFCKEQKKDLTLFFEPGKFLVSESGFLLAKTNVIKQTTATVFAGVDSGLNHLIRPMMYDAYHHITNISNPEGQKRIYTVVGYICETDTFGWDRKLDEVKEGDILAFHNAGAYCYSMASNYNSRVRPPEVAIYQGQSYLIREREELEDLLKGQTEVEINFLQTV